MLVLAIYDCSLPEIRAWGPMDAEIQWGYQRDVVNTSNAKVKEEMLKDEEKFMSEIGGKLIAHGFQRELKCIWPDMEDANEQTWYNGIFKSIKNMFFTVEPRAPPSMADPSFLLGQPIKNEEDILHIKKLPDFDKSLSARNAELLLSI